MGTHWYRHHGPTDTDLANYVPATGSGEPTPKVWKSVTLSDDNAKPDLDTVLALQGWQPASAPTIPAFTQSYSTEAFTVAALPSWSAPGITAGYIGGVTLLTGASAADLNDLAGKCATLEAQISALRSRVEEDRQVINALINLVKARGMAT